MIHEADKPRCHVSRLAGRNGTLRTVCLSMLAFGVCFIAASGFDARGSDLRPGILGNDDRVRVLDDPPVWHAIGQVNVAGYRTMKKCTGTLVAPDRVVTAAHCVRGGAHASAFRADSIHFVAGVRGSTHKGHATANCVRFPLKGATLSTTHSVQSTSAPGRDIAVIILKSRSFTTRTTTFGVSNKWPRSDGQFMPVFAMSPTSQPIKIYDIK